MGDKTNKKHTPGDGIRSLQSSPMFRAINYELYVKPVIIKISLFYFQTLNIII